MLRIRRASSAVILIIKSSSIITSDQVILKSNDGVNENRSRDHVQEQSSISWISHPEVKSLDQFHVTSLTCIRNPFTDQEFIFFQISHFTFRITRVVIMNLGSNCTDSTKSPIY